MIEQVDLILENLKKIQEALLEMRNAMLRDDTRHERSFAPTDIGEAMNPIDPADPLAVEPAINIARLGDDYIHNLIANFEGK